MRCLNKLPNFNATHKVPPSRGRYIADRIAGRSRSAYYRLLAALLILATAIPASVSAYSTGEPGRFPITAQGSSGKETVIEVRTSPGVYLPGPTFRIQVTSAKPVTPRVPEFLQETIERTLLRNDPRLRVAPSSPDTSIVCSIVDLSVLPGVDNRMRQEYQKTGETIITDPTTGTSRTEDVYSYVDVPYRALIFEGRMSVKCEVTDVATGILLYSDRFDAVYSDAREVGYGAGVNSVDDLNLIYLKLADNAAGLILAQLCPRVFSEIVRLARGNLKAASKLMESGHWSDALTLLTSMPAFKNPKDDAYRLYSIGVAHEALAYKSLDHVEKKRQLERAVDNYQRAAELKPNEDMFWAPKYRAEAVLSATSGLVAQVEIFEAAKRRSSNAATAPDRIAAGNTDLFREARTRRHSGPPLINNQTVVQWVKAGRSADYITASIKHAPGTRFDLSQAEVLKLRREGVSKGVLKAMAKSQPGYFPGFGRAKAAMVAISLFWWLPWVFAR